MPNKKLSDYLDNNHVRYSCVNHPVAYATREISHVSHIPEKQLAKTVIINAGKKQVMVILPSNQAIDFNALKSALHEQNVSLATEKEFSNKFPDCEVGAMPPFGNLYNMDVYVDKALTTNKEIAFNAGSHNEIMKISCQDYVSLVKPKIINLMH